MIRNLGQVAAIYVGSSAPRNTNLIWLDNTVVPFVFRAYDGSAWSELATHKWVRAYVDGWLVTLPPRQLADDGDYMLINSNNVNYKITVKDFVKSAVGNPLDFKGVIRVSADFPNPSTLEAGDMYVIITSPVGGTVTDPYSGKTFEDSEKIVWDEVTRSWESLGKINITVNLTTSYSETEVTIHSSAGKETTIQGATDQLAGVMLPGQYSWLQALSNGSIVPGDPSPLTPLTPAHKHNYNDIINRLVSQQGTGESTIDPMSQKATTDALNLKFDKASVLQVSGAATDKVMSQKATTDALNLKFDKASVLQVSGAATDKVMSQKAVTDALKTLSDDFNNKLTNYLPLSGGNMTGNIVFNNNLFLYWKTSKGLAYQVLSMKSNDEINIGNAAFPLNLYSKADLFHKRNNENAYKIWDAYNLPTPASTTDLANYLPLIGGTLTGQLTIKQEADIKLRLQSTDADNHCIIQAINSQASQLGVFGYAGDKWVIGYNGTYYEIWDKFNLPDPVTLSGNNTFTGSNIFSKTLKIGSQSAYSEINPAIGVSYHYETDISVSRGYRIVLGDSIKYDFVFGGMFDGNLDTPNMYSYITTGQNTFITTPYKFYSNKFSVSSTMVVPESSFRIFTGDITLLYYNKSNKNVQLGSSDSSMSLELLAQNLYYTKYDSASSTWKNYTIYSEYNLPTPVTYTTNTYNHATLTNKDGQYFTYIKAGTNGLLPHSQVTLANGGAGFLGTSDQSFNAAYINHLYTNKISFGVNGPYIIGSTSATQFLDANGGAQKVATGGLYVGVSYASDALNLVPTNGIYSSGAIKSAAGFTSNFRQTNLNLAKTGNDVLYISSFVVDSTGAPGTDSNTGRTIDDGMFLTYFWQNDHAFQLAADIDGTGIAYRHYIPSTGNSTTGWRFLADTSWVVSKINSSTSNYLPLTGGTLSGNLTINTVGSTTLVINNNDTNGSETFMRVLRKGTASAAIGFRDSLGAYIYNYNSNKYLFIDNDGYVRVGTTNGSTRLALITDIPTVSGYLPLSGGTMTGALTMNNRKNNAVIDVVGGAGNNWNGGAGALSVQVPNDSGQTPLLLARRSGATINTTTLSERLLDMALLDNGIIFKVGMSGAVALELEVTSFTNKVGIGKLFGKQIATTDQIPSIPSISISNSGSGNAVTAISASGHTLTVTKGATYLPLSGGTMTGALTMNNRKNNAVIDVVGGAGNNWNGGAGALSVQVPNDSGQTPLLLARRSGATINTTTLSERLLDMALLDNGIIFKVGMSGAVALELEVTSFTNKVGIGKLFGKQIATTDQIPSIPSISISNSGSGNAVTAISASGHTLTVTKGATYLTSSSLDGYATQSWANGQFASLSLYNTTGSYTTIRTRGNEFCLGNTIATSASNEVIVNYRIPSGCTYAPSTWVWRAGSSTSYANGYWGSLYMNGDLVATQTWVNNKGYLTSHQTIYNLTFQAGTFSAKTFDPNGAAATVNIPTNTSHLTNDSGFITSSALNGYATQAWVNSQNFVKSTSTKKVTDIQPVDALPATQASGVLYLVFG